MTQKAVININKTNTIKPSWKFYQCLRADIPAPDKYELMTQSAQSDCSADLMREFTVYVITWQ